MLFDVATAHLLERKVLLPAAGTLAELVAGVREAAAHRLWTLLEGLTTPEQAAALGRLLEVEPDARVSRPRADQGQRPQVAPLKVRDPWT